MRLRGAVAVVTGAARGIGRVTRDFEETRAGTRTTARPEAQQDR